MLPTVREIVKGNQERLSSKAISNLKFNSHKFLNDRVKGLRSMRIEV